MMVMYLSTKQTIDTIIDRLNAGLEVIVTEWNKVGKPLIFKNKRV